MGDQRGLNPQPFISQTNALPLSYNRHESLPLFPLLLKSFLNLSFDPIVNGFPFLLFSCSHLTFSSIRIALSSPSTLESFYSHQLFVISTYLVSSWLHTHSHLFFVLSFFDFAFSFSFPPLLTTL